MSHGPQPPGLPVSPSPRPSYLPQWRALAGARSLLGDLAKIWKKDHWFYVGRIDDVAEVRGCLGRRVRIFGRGRDWPEALAAARLAFEALPKSPDRDTVIP